MRSKSVEWLHKQSSTVTMIKIGKIWNIDHISALNSIEWDSFKWQNSSVLNFFFHSKVQSQLIYKITYNILNTASQHVHFNWEWVYCLLKPLINSFVFQVRDVNTHWTKSVQRVFNFLFSSLYLNIIIMHCNDFFHITDVKSSHCTACVGLYVLS